jgi:molybdenum-dependent DNA-binding transcriptional regulator ModE
MNSPIQRDLIIGDFGGTPQSDAELTDLLKRSVILEKEKRKTIRPSWKTEYKSAFKQKEKLRVQRNLTVTLAACYIFVDLLIKIFS